MRCERLGLACVARDRKKRVSFSRTPNYVKDEVRALNNKIKNNNLIPYPKRLAQAQQH